VATIFCHIKSDAGEGERSNAVPLIDFMYLPLHSLTRLGLHLLYRD